MFMAENAASIEPPLRALLFLALIWLLGLSVGFELVLKPVLERSLTPRLEQEIRSRQLLAAGILAAASVGLLAAQLAPLEVDWTSADEWRALFTTAAFGQMALLRVLLSGVVVAVLLALRGRLRMLPVAVLALLIAATITRTGHSAAMDSGLQSIAASFAHLVAGALWAGGLTVLVLASDAAAEQSETAAASILRMIKRFSPFGLAAVALASGAGMLLTGVHIETLDAFRTTYFGRVLSVKLVVVLLAVALAAWHRFSTQRRLKTAADVEGFRRTLWIELLLVHVIFYGAALMTTASTPGMSHGDMPGVQIAGFTLKQWSEIAVACIALATLIVALANMRLRVSTK